MKEGNNGTNEYFYHKNNDVIGNININPSDPFSQYLYFQSIQKSLPNRLKNTQSFSFAVFEKIPILKSIITRIEQFHHFLFTKFIHPSYPTNFLIYFAILLLFFSYLLQITFSQHHLQKSPPLYIYFFNLKLSLTCFLCFFIYFRLNFPNIFLYIYIYISATITNNVECFHKTERISRQAR